MKTPEEIAADAANEIADYDFKYREIPVYRITAIIARHIAPLTSALAAQALRIAELESEVLDEVEDRARQTCHTQKADRDYIIPEAGTLVTDSGAMSSRAYDLRLLHKYGRFRIVSEVGRMVVGYWPENDPQKKQESKP